MKPLRFQAEAVFGLRPDELWPFVADTQRLNRAIGLPDAHFAFEPRPDGGSWATGEYRRAGLVLSRWREHPFDFVRPRFYRVLREYSLGPFTRVFGGADLSPVPEGTRLRVWAEITPLRLWGWLLAQLLVGPRSTSRVLARCREYERELSRRKAAAQPEEVAVPQAEMAVYTGPSPQVDLPRLDQRVANLVRAGGHPEIVRHLRDHLARAPDDQVASMRPFVLADLWGADRRETLGTFFLATTVGLLEMRWEVLCPNCRAPKARAPTLSALGAQAHCEVCSIQFDANFDRLVEVRFSPAPSIRTAAVGVFCIGGPQNRPHLVAQTELAPGQEARWETDLPAGKYHVASPQARSSALVEVQPEGAGPEARVALAAEGLRPPLLQVRAGPAALTVRNELQAPVVVALEELRWADTAATAALVSTMAEFRDLFSAEVLAPGLQIAIERLTLLFTDLAGSTALYQRIGQARAFRLVQDHFTILDQAIRAHNGAMVKTIGDAVMAVFPTTLDAAEAALQMQCALRHLPVAEGVDPAHLLKIGIHAGPCVAVTLNDRLDYFGTAVNIAARTEAQARGGEITLTVDAWDEPGVAERLTAAAERVEQADVVLRGITEPVRLWRLSDIRCPG